jgi:hypothetical protein
MVTSSDPSFDRVDRRGFAGRQALGVNRLDWSVIVSIRLDSTDPRKIIIAGPGYLEYDGGGVVSSRYPTNLYIDTGENAVRFHRALSHAASLSGARLTADIF